MGYTTKFSGHLALSRRLTMLEAKQLLTFSEEPDTINGPHPNSYLQWVPSESLDAIVFDGGEKFYEYDKWLEWLLAWLGSAGVMASGEFIWQGEDTGDVGMLRVIDSKLHVMTGKPAARSVHKPLTLRRLAEMALEQVTA